jgi:hypothetical protein
MLTSLHVVWAPDQPVAICLQLLDFDLVPLRQVLKWD